MCLSVCLSLSLSSMTLRSSFVLLLVISTTWLFGLLAVNNSVLAFHYLYTVLCSLQVTARPLPGEGTSQHKTVSLLSLQPPVESRHPVHCPQCPTVLLSLLLSPLQQQLTPAGMAAVPAVTQCRRWLRGAWFSGDIQKTIFGGKGPPCFQRAEQKSTLQWSCQARRYDPRQHPADLLPTPWLVSLQGTLPAAPWPLPARRTPQPFPPHPWPPREVALTSAEGLFDVSQCWWPLKPTHWALQEPGTVPARGCL